MVNRREILAVSLCAVAGALAIPARAQHGSAPMPSGCASDGTPAQFIPKGPPDPKAFENDLQKYPKCPYCGMGRRKFHHSRMLIQYSDDLADGVCSLHCAAVSLSLNVDREPKTIWVGDNAPGGEAAALVDADKATFLLGSAIPGVMTGNSKVAYGDADAARKAQEANGGSLANFEQALLAAYTDMAKDVARIRKMRAGRRRHGMKEKHG